MSLRSLAAPRLMPDDDDDEPVGGRLLYYYDCPETPPPRHILVWAGNGCLITGNERNSTNNKTVVTP